MFFVRLAAITLASLFLGCDANLSGSTLEPEASDGWVPPIDGGPGAPTEDAGPGDPDGGGTDASPPEPPPDGTIPLFVGTGDGARTIVSCDDGLTWVADETVSPGAGDHHAFAVRGLAAGVGVFVAAFGWGAPGHIRISEDGTNWGQTMPGGGFTHDDAMVDVVFGAEEFLAISDDVTLASDDAGETWHERGELVGRGLVRSMFYAAYGEGRLFATGDDNRLEYSGDGGRVWQIPSTLPSGCGGGFQRRGGWAYGDGVVVIVRDSGTTCRSADGGDTWTTGTLPAGGRCDGNVIWTGEDFYVVDDGQVFRSVDGASWQAVSIPTGGVRLRNVARSPVTGTYVAAARDGEAFFRSSDGETWTRLSAEAGPPGAELKKLQFGYGVTPSACR